MNRDTFAGKLQYHTEHWISAGLVGFALCVVAWGGWNVADDTFQRVAPASFYFEYDVKNPVVPVRSSIHYSEHMQFHSNARFFRAIDMEWSDTLYCRMRGGDFVVKIGTQIWKERVAPKITGEAEVWEWNKSPFPPGASECQLRGVVLGTTSRGHIKTFEYKTMWWTVVG